jgi:hypothetical protein
MKCKLICKFAFEGGPSSGPNRVFLESTTAAEVAAALTSGGVLAAAGGAPAHE